jgi:hypothetical protein
MMDVYLVPTGADRYELYCEPAGAPLADVDAPPTSLWGRGVATFRRALAEGEEARRGRASGDPSRLGRIRLAIMCRIAEAVAEQRLLWRLRRETAACLHHPDDMAGADADTHARRRLGGDRDKHRRWFVIDGLLTVASAPIALLPGPNVFAYYFIFRTVGHFLSMRGAEQGLRVVRWQPLASPPLTGIRTALPLEPATRTQRLHEIAAALGLEDLAPFVEHVASRN